MAVRPGLQEPAAAARMAATLDRISDGRLLINVVTGGDPVELRGDGVFLDHDERYEVTDEFLHIWRALLAGETVTYQGEHLAIEDGRCSFPPVQKPYPPLYFGGSSRGRHRGRGRARRRLPDLGRAARRRGREDRGGPRRGGTAGRTLSLRHPPARDRARDARRGLARRRRTHRRLDDATIAAAQKTFARYDSVGQSRMARLHGGRRDKLEIAPNLWAGVGLVRGGAGTALVGDPDRWPSA